jgi:cobalamin biosynthesis protein CobT
MTRDTITTGIILALCGLVLHGWFTQLSGHPRDDTAHPIALIHDIAEDVARLKQQAKDQTADAKAAAEAVGRTELFRDIRDSNQKMVTDLAASMRAALITALEASCARPTAADAAEETP